MSAHKFSARRRTLVASACSVALVAVLAACGSSAESHHSSMPGMSHSDNAMASTSPSASASSSMPAMPGMDAPMPAGDGLSESSGGYRMVSASTAQAMAGMPMPYRFTINDPAGKPVTGFAVDQTKRLHFYAIRSDLTGFQHLHPTMSADGTWRANLASLQPGTWRMFASFTPDSGVGKGKDFVLSRTLVVPGGAVAVPLPKAASTTTVDGYTVTVKGDLMAGMAHELTVSFAKNGKPVSDLQPYLDTYAHLTAFHAGDQAFAHLHPQVKVDGDHGGPDLTFHAELAKAGNWRLYLQFQTGGTLHTAALTLHVS